MADCIFCKIVAREIPGEIVYEDDETLAFKDINPQAPVHILVITKKHLASLAEVGEADKGLLGHINLVISRLAREKGISEKGYRVVVNTGAEGGQTVPHLHFHLLGGRSFKWPPG